MVDVDTGSNDDEDKSKKRKKKKSKKKRKKKGRKSKSNTDNSEVEPFEVDDEQRFDTDEAEVSEPAKNLAEGGELNNDARDRESFKAYVSRQISECEELYEDMEKNMKDVDGYEEFAIYMHALYMNFGINRVGIMNTIMDEFGKDEKEAMRYTDKICRKAGEEDLFMKTVRYITKDFAGE